MRWPFGPRARRESGHDASSTPDDAWRAVEPLRPFLTRQELVTEPTAFAAELVTRQSPVFLAPLGHELADDGPTGIVTGLAEAARPEPQPSARRPEPAHRSTTAAAAPTGPPRATWPRGTAEAPTPEPMPVQRATVAPTATATAPLTQAPPVAQHRRVVAAPSASRTDAATELVPPPVATSVSRVTAPDPTSHRFGESTAPTVDSDISATADAAAEVQRMQPSIGDRADAPPLATPDVADLLGGRPIGPIASPSPPPAAAPSAEPVAPVPDIASPRAEAPRPRPRVGLGAPLPRGEIPTPEPSARPPAPDRDSPAVQRTTTATTRAPAPTPAPSAAAAPVAPDARASVHADGGPEPATESSTSPDATPAVPDRPTEPEATSTAIPSRPLLGHDPPIVERPTPAPPRPASPRSAPEPRDHARTPAPPTGPTDVVHAPLAVGATPPSPVAHPVAHPVARTPVTGAGGPSLGSAVPIQRAVLGLRDVPLATGVRAATPPREEAPTRPTAARAQAHPSVVTHSTPTAEGVTVRASGGAATEPTGPTGTVRTLPRATGHDTASTTRLLPTTPAPLQRAARSASLPVASRPAAAPARPHADAAPMVEVGAALPVAVTSGLGRLDEESGAVVFHHPDDEAVVQREAMDATPDPAPEPWSSAGAPSEPAAVVAAAAPAAKSGAPAAPSGDDLDRLARRLYPRIRDQWKAEIRLDRERSGHVLDRIR